VFLSFFLTTKYISKARNHTRRTKLARRNSTLHLQGYKSQKLRKTNHTPNNLERKKNSQNNKTTKQKQTDYTK
jgi:hypothetical protein